MTYELLFQAPAGGPPFEEAAVRTALAAQGPLARGAAEVAPVHEAGRVVALSVKVPFSTEPTAVKELVEQACGVAAAAGVVLCDPQLMRALRDADAGAVVESYERAARYAGEYLGDPGAIGRASYGTQPVDPGKLKPGTKVALGLAALLMLAYWILGRLIG